MRRLSPILPLLAFLTGCTATQPPAARFPADSIAALELAWKNGDADAAYFLGGMCRRGWGVAQDSVQAIAWFEKAASAGHFEAGYSLLCMYQGGEHLDRQAEARETAKWRQWLVERLEVRARSGDRAAMFELGEIGQRRLRAADCPHGRLTYAISAAAGRQWREQAARAGHPLALMAMAADCTYGKGLPSPPRAVEEQARWLAKAEATGDPEVLFMLIWHASDPARKADLLKRSAMGGCAPAMRELAYSAGSGEERRRWHIRAAQTGEFTAMRTVPPDSAAALGWLKKQADSGILLPAESFPEGDGDSKYWLRQAAERGDLQALAAGGFAGNLPKDASVTDRLSATYVGAFLCEAFAEEYHGVRVGGSSKGQYRTQREKLEAGMPAQALEKARAEAEAWKNTIIWRRFQESKVPAQFAQWRGHGW